MAYSIAGSIGDKEKSVRVGAGYYAIEANAFRISAAAVSNLSAAASISSTHCALATWNDSSSGMMLIPQIPLRARGPKSPSKPFLLTGSM